MAWTIRKLSRSHCYPSTMWISRHNSRVHTVYTSSAQNILEFAQRIFDYTKKPHWTVAFKQKKKKRNEMKRNTLISLDNWCCWHGFAFGFFPSSISVSFSTNLHFEQKLQMHSLTKSSATTTALSTTETTKAALKKSHSNLCISI